jgi:hypothetical protein
VVCLKCVLNQSTLVVDVLVTVVRGVMCLSPKRFSIVDENLPSPHVFQIKKQ